MPTSLLTQKLSRQEDDGSHGGKDVSRYMRDFLPVMISFGTHLTHTYTRLVKLKTVIGLIMGKCKSQAVVYLMTDSSHL